MKNLKSHNLNSSKSIKNMSKMAQSEVHAYKFILDELTKKKEWDKQDIFTQQECHKIKAIKDSLKLQKPENVVKINETTFYIIESKNERKKLDIALKEARDYADLINKGKSGKALFITGIAGNDEEGFIGKSQFFNLRQWETITENEIEITSIISKKQVEKILENSDAKLKDVEISDSEFIQAAKRINEILHEYSIPKDTRGKFMSALLLVLSEGSPIDLNEKETMLLISAINSRVDSILSKHGKSGFSKFIKIDEPSSASNHIKYRIAIVKTIQELLALNIRSAMNSGKDILGEFYEIFLKYGNGAKEIGIVLTPRHITKFAAEVLDIKTNDLILDPTCGTGGFLVSALDEAKKKSKSKDEVEYFKKYGIYGIEQQDPVIALAIVNMIFRGDGKTNMKEGNCFDNWLYLKSSNGKVYADYKDSDSDGRIPPITRVLMNPPFSQKSSKEKEYHFIEHALKQMQDEGILFSVLPMSVLIERPTKQWRKDLLKNNTLLSVITFPADLFYPTGTHTVGLFLRKGISHPKNKKVLWIRALNDGFIKKKGKRLKNERAKNDFPKIKEELKAFIFNKNEKIKNIPQFQKLCAIDFEDENLELVPENYLDEEEIKEDKLEEEIENLMRENIAFNIKFENRLKELK